MPTERVVEIPWALQQIPQHGRILDVGSCDATYLGVIQGLDRELHCLDPRNCATHLPPGSTFHRGSLIGNRLRPRHFDAVLMISTLEHIGLPCYGQRPLGGGDRLALAEARDLLRPGGRLVFTVPAGISKLMTWSRQYSPADLRALLRGWRAKVTYWGFVAGGYRPISVAEVEHHDYRDGLDEDGGAGAVAGVVAEPT